MKLRLADAHAAKVFERWRVLAGRQAKPLHRRAELQSGSASGRTCPKPIWKSARLARRAGKGITSRAATRAAQSDPRKIQLRSTAYAPGGSGVLQPPKGRPHFETDAAQRLAQQPPSRSSGYWASRTFKKVIGLGPPAALFAAPMCKALLHLQQSFVRGCRAAHGETRLGPAWALVSQSTEICQVESGL